MSDQKTGDVLERQPTTGGFIGATVLGVLVGFGVALVSDNWDTTAEFIITGIIVSLVATVIFAIVYAASVEQDNKKARDQRIAEASTRYLQERDDTR